MVAARYGLANLTAIVDCNGLQQYGWPRDACRRDSRGDRRDPLAGTDLRAALEAFGWRVLEIDGHDTRRSWPPAPTPARRRPAGRPTAILARPSRAAACRSPRAASSGTPRSPRPTSVGGARARARRSSRGGRRRDRWRCATRGPTRCSTSPPTNPDLLVLDGDLGTSTRADRFAAAYPDRFLQMGIAEQNMVGVAVGPGDAGLRPVALVVRRVLHPSSGRTRSGCSSPRPTPT